MKKYLKFIIPALALLGIADATYLSLEHAGKIIAPCSTLIPFVDCGAVLGSKYAYFFGIPLATIGIVQYFLELLFAYYAVFVKSFWGRTLFLIQSAIGAIASLVFVYLQIFVIGSLCLYCMGSALISFALFSLVWGVYERERKVLAIYKTWFLYKFILKKILFLTSPDFIHEAMTAVGEALGKSKLARGVFSFLYGFEDKKLSQTLAGISFANPAGLAAGFDYKAQLTNILAPLGFGFQAIGSVTNSPYEGNPPPMLGRLPKSKSLMVNKGFKSEGAEKVAKKLNGQKFAIPVGISIGMSNSENIRSQKEAIEDVANTFKTFEKASFKNTYYEMNISCPNLIHGKHISFYPPKNLDDLLFALDKLKLERPVFIKMPITESDKETLAMLAVIAKHKIAGVIFGNLQKDRKNKALVKEEVNKFKVGNFSGKPTWERSNELIRLAYKNYQGKLLIIGCGGIFNGADAYHKIKLGANLVQFITGMIYEGPQTAAKINYEIAKLLTRDGFDHISEAVGSAN